MTQEPVPEAGGDGYGFRLGQVRLYQPEDQRVSRLPSGTAGIAAYCKTLLWVGTEYFGQLGRDFGPMGILVGVGVRPNRRTRLWCPQVSGDLPPDVWEGFVELLQGAGAEVKPDVTAPVAFALECVLGDGPSERFPELPRAWQEAAAAYGGGLSVPDELFTIVFPE